MEYFVQNDRNFSRYVWPSVSGGRRKTNRPPAGRPVITWRWCRPRGVGSALRRVVQVAERVVARGLGLGQLGPHLGAGQVAALVGDLGRVLLFTVGDQAGGLGLGRFVLDLGAAQMRGWGSAGGRVVQIAEAVLAVGLGLGQFGLHLGAGQGLGLVGGLGTGSDAQGKQ